jgi:hypothetical protein
MVACHRVLGIVPLCSLLLAAEAGAQDPVRPDSARLAIARQIVVLTSDSAATTNLTDATLRASGLDRAAPDLHRQMVAESRARWERIVEVLASTYATHLTLAELDALLSFHRSPLGRRLLEVQPLVMKEMIAEGQRWANDLIRRIAPGPPP